MNKIPELIPISEMRVHQTEILAQIKQGPVVLTHRSKAAAVLVDPAYWNDLMEQLEDAQDLLAIRRQEQEEEAGEATLIPIDEEELRDWAGDDLSA